MHTWLEERIEEEKLLVKIKKELKGKDKIIMDRIIKKLQSTI